MKRVLLLLAILAAGAASAQTYQVGQYLGNLHEAGRFAWGTMGGATANIPHSSPATWSAFQPGVLRHSAQASATIGGRTVPLTLLSRVPVAGIANAARAVSLANPATAAVTLLGFAAMQGWLTPAGLEWNPDAATNLTKPFLKAKTDVMSLCQVSDAAGYNAWVAGQNQETSDYKNTATAHVWMETGLCHYGANVTTEYKYSRPSSNGIAGPYLSEPPVPLSSLSKEPATWDQAIPNLSNPPGDMAAVDWKSIAEGLLQRGASFPQPTEQTLSGPAQQPGQKTTKQNADGTTTTTQTTNNYNYAGNTITVTTTTNSTVTNNAGDTISTESETTEEAEQQAATDSPLPGTPELYERKYPNGIKGVWDEKIAVIKTSSLFGMVPGLTPNLGDGGCPVWTMPVDIGLIDFGTYDVSIPCSVWAFVRVVIILTAMFLARRLMFGG